MSFEVFSQLVNKNSNKGVDQVLNYMDTNPLFLHKPIINKEPISEPSIRAYYNIKTVDNGVDPTAFAQFTRDKYHSQDLQFKNYNRKVLINDLKSGHSNYANDYLVFNRAYLNNNGKALIRNNTILAGLYMNENNTPKNVPFTSAGGPGAAPGPDPSGGAPDPSGAGGAPEPGGGAPEPGGGAASGGAPDPPKVVEDTEENKKAATTLQKVARGFVGRKKGVRDEVGDQIAKTGSGTREKLKAKVDERKGKLGYTKVVEEQPTDKTKSKVVYKKLEGVTPVKASSSAQPVEAKPEPEPEYPDSPKSGDTKVEDPPKMKEHKDLLKTNYQIPYDVTNSIDYRGSTEKIGLMNEIALRLFQRNRSNEFLEAVATTGSTTTGKRSLKTPQQLQAMLEVIKKLKKVE